MDEKKKQFKAFLMFPDGEIYEREFDSKEEMEEHMARLFKKSGVTEEDYDKVVMIDGVVAGES